VTGWDGRWGVGRVGRGRETAMSSCDQGGVYLVVLESMNAWFDVAL